MNCNNIEVNIKMSDNSIEQWSKAFKKLNYAFDKAAKSLTIPAIKIESIYVNKMFQSTERDFDLGVFE